MRAAQQAQAFKEISLHPQALAVGAGKNEIAQGILARAGPGDGRTGEFVPPPQFGCARRRLNRLSDSLQCRAIVLGDKLLQFGLLGGPAQPLLPDSAQIALPSIV